MAGLSAGAVVAIVANVAVAVLLLLLCAVLLRARRTATHRDPRGESGSLNKCRRLNKTFPAKALLLHAETPLYREPFWPLAG
ncbi:unnamed protein product [Lampetra planeri]